ncbi:MAG: DNA gyrase subunit A, partial [Roseitalea porphyridii]
MSKTVQPPGDGDGPGREVEPIDLKSALEERYLAYALSTIMHRALPDARDGMKPVHRRILYVMRLLRLNPEAAYRKCAKIVGDVMGNFHPHGDQAIYDALVRLAQDFSVRYPLVDGQGNFGNIDGDSPAAYRYTEARMTEVGTLLLEGITEDAVDFRPNYNEEDTEPVVLPGAFPNLLANGSSGIAVGMATNIPPHNLGEVIDATVHLLEHPDADVDALMEHVKGPDFPTGGQILGRSGINDAYRTGRGSVKMRAKASIEESKSGGYEIVVTELPYQTSCSAIAKRIQELVDNGDLDGIRDVNDGSAGGKTNLVITLKRDANANVVLNNLFKMTQLQSSFSINMVALVKGVPRTLNLLTALEGYVDHQIEVVTRRSKFRLQKARDREHIVEGLIKAL